MPNPGIIEASDITEEIARPDSARNKRTVYIITHPPKMDRHRRKTTVIWAAVTRITNELSAQLHSSDATSDELTQHFNIPAIKQVSLKEEDREVDMV